MKKREKHHEGEEARQTRFPAHGQGGGCCSVPMLAEYLFEGHVRTRLWVEWPRVLDRHATW
jgi:hypothetical protein